MEKRVGCIVEKLWMAGSVKHLLIFVNQKTSDDKNSPTAFGFIQTVKWK